MGALTLAGADNFFTPSNKGSMGQWWESLDQDTRAAGIAEAKRILERTYGRTLVAPSATATNLQVRDDYALYEQAAFGIMRSGFRANAEWTASGFDLFGVDGEPVTTTGSEISAEAQRWMRKNRLQIARG